jgi:hypothetical protein
MKKIFPLTMVTACLFILTACMYPTEERQQLGDVGNHVSRVQAQSEQYLQQHKTLPYKYSAEDRKFTSHYLVDFTLMPEIPMTAYEKGGNFLYVYIGAEGNQPLVRLFDLRVNNEVEKVQLAVNHYKAKNKSLPFKAKGPDGFFEVDLEKLHLSDIKIPSPYFSDAQLPFLMDKNGRIFLDYRGDVTRLMQTVKQKPSAEEDLRLYMAKNSLFVPAFCPPLKLGNKGALLFVS